MSSWLHFSPLFRPPCSHTALHLSGEPIRPFHICWVVEDCEDPSGTLIRWCFIGIYWDPPGLQYTSEEWRRKVRWLHPTLTACASFGIIYSLFTPSPSCQLCEVCRGRMWQHTAPRLFIFQPFWLSSPQHLSSFSPPVLHTHLHHTHTNTHTHYDESD